MDFGNDFLREFASHSDTTSFSIQRLFHQVLDFHIVFHFVEFAKDDLAIGVLRKVVNGVIFNFYLMDLNVVCGPVESDVIFNVVNL